MQGHETMLPWLPFCPAEFGRQLPSSQTLSLTAPSAAGGSATHHLKVCAHEAVEVLLVAAIKLRKQSKSILKRWLKPDQGLVLNGRKSEQGKHPRY